MYNIHFNLFQEECKSSSALQLQTSSKEGKLDVKYSYDGNGTKYEVSDSYYKDVFTNRIGENPISVTICYNASFPKYHYIQGINFKGRYYHVGLVLGGFFLTLTILFDIYGNKSRMAEKYEKAFKG